MQTSGMYSEPNRARQQTPASTADDGAGYGELQDSQTLTHGKQRDPLTMPQTGGAVVYPGTAWNQGRARNGKSLHAGLVR